MRSMYVRDLVTSVSISESSTGKFAVVITFLISSFCLLLQDFSGPGELYVR